MAQPENQFIQRIHKKLPPLPMDRGGDVLVKRSGVWLYREKMHNEFRGGTADVWYSGMKADLWVEYKWVAKLSSKCLVPGSPFMKPALSPRQVTWLNGRYQDGRNVAVIVGSPEGCGIFTRPHQWASGQYVARLHSEKEVAEWITQKCGSVGSHASQSGRGTSIQSSSTEC